MLFSADQNVYIGKETFMSSGYGFPMIKGSPLQGHVNKL
jgi:hypothetical protein